MINFRMDRRLAARVDPDDILQEAYLDAERRLHRFRADNGHSVFIWLRLICSQTLINVFRRHLDTSMRDAGREVSLQQRTAGQSTSISIARQFAASGASPSQAAVRGEASAQLISALESMDPVDREIIALRHFEDLSNAEVAVVLEIKPTAASNRYVRAIARLRTVLRPFPQDPNAAGEPGDE
jgi:RNA polymerase sigma-70 factor (ECF subfamily)